MPRYTAWSCVVLSRAPHCAVTSRPPDLRGRHLRHVGDRGPWRARGGRRLERLARPGYVPRPLPVTMPFRRPLAFATPKAACALPPTTAAAAAIFSYAASSNLFIGASRKNTATPGTVRLDATEQYFFCDARTPKTIMIGVRCSTKEFPTRLAVRCASSQTICQYRNMY